MVHSHGNKSTILIKLLRACIKHVQFNDYLSNIYTQADDVAMNRPLGPLFTSNFYMAHLVNKNKKKDSLFKTYFVNILFECM